MKRPMFRKGGSAGEGITSGLAPRQGYQEAGDVKQNDLSKLNNIRDLTPQQILELSKQMSFQAPPMAPDNSLKNFKIDFGLDLLSRSPQGNIFQTAGASAKEPFANFRNSRAAYNKGVQDRAVTKYNSQTGMFDTLLGAQAKILGSDGGSKTFAKQANDAEIQALMTELFTLDANQKTDQALSEEEYAQKQAILMQRLQGYTGKNPAVTSLFGNKEQADIVIQGIQNDITNSEAIIKVMGPDGEMIEVVEGEYANENPKYIAEETAKRYITLYNKMIKESMGLAEGGRAGYSNGMMVEDTTILEKLKATDPEKALRDSGELPPLTMQPKETAPTGDSLSYEELRSRLPKEVTDDIVVILAESPQALVDFAEIQTQTDVDEFNMKYGVNLSLPSGA